MSIKRMAVSSFLVAAVCAWGAPAAAFDEPVDYTSYSLSELMELSVVSGASKYVQKTKEAPSSISIITKEEIRTFGWTTLGEVLTSLRGFHATYDRNYLYLGVRGIGYPGDLSSRLLVLVDGIRVNEMGLGGVLMGEGFPVELDLIERIEVIRGPASSIYGTNALLGIVNIVTREGYQLDGVEMRTGVSSFGGRDGRVTIGHETESGVDLLVSGSFGVSDGQDHYIEEFDDPAYNDGVFEDGDAEKWRNAFAKVMYENLSFEFMHSWRQKWNPMAPVGVIFNENTFWTVDEQTFIGGRYTRDVAWDVEMTLRANYQHHAFEMQAPYDYDYAGNPVDWIDYYRDKSWGKRLTTELDFTRTFAGGHVIAAGVEYQKNFQMDIIAYDEDPYWEWYNFSQTPENFSYYVVGDARIMDGLLLNAGLRHDHYKSFGGSTNPRLALVTEPRRGTVFKFLYGEAFRAPNGYEIPEEDNPESAGLTVTPNEIETFEIVWEQDLGKGLYSTVSWYDYDYRDVNDGNDQTDLPPEEWVNDAISSEGYEIELAARLPRGVAGRVSYSHNKATDRLWNPVWGEPGGPEEMVKANVSVPLHGKHTRLGLEVRHDSRRLTRLREYVDHFTVVNLTVVDSSLMDGLEVRGSVTNLFDTDVPHPATWGEYQQVIWQDGRAYRLYFTLSH